ncbi:hypothetical protein [Nesterenkonia sp. NBAIMH1]|uniref:hypothetical protein n=1 Tax=Nesterenkonia sp. NBAIMH1 TaxID=2600320 RepID=UPI0011B3A1A3|nr:hypothetical protein [Nesterenkonia sp. NBAIMH1]
MKTLALIRLAWRITVGVTLFNAVTAVAGGVAIVLTGGLGMPASMLSNSSFDSFLWPGIILVVIVGGTQLVAAVLTIARQSSAPLWVAVAGCSMVIWIFVETVLIEGFSWLQGLYFATGLLQLILVIGILTAAARGNTAVFLMAQP